MIAKLFNHLQHGNTDLHIAVMTQQPDMVLAVFENRETNLLKVNKLDETPLDIAQDDQNDKILAIFQRRRDDLSEVKEDDIGEQGQESIYEEEEEEYDSIGELEEEHIGVVNSTNLQEKPS